ncbi:sigma-54-dependent transcriptional regulator [Paracoccus denitrificans]|jgi:two-component system C4-dicarboxylate transport response regulator DctD|uniref:Two component, sigma54 specific, transcriptional regulator, Fis family n=1 Tax=Paracoccus denitrificans (strain Pd 1222) TaxID=318586 RepID=A1BB24_PARDP|nr:sigma-54 dependent transcriptional regulator [Paracoccus denitrificans]ABL72718.1 two component, sigma54 specific, transcriptional regulator, Fis family [Paracoccus denitrificans PD1222]MBB4626196.1 two-component system C4-dicarboxylate transport response regulator DctD [Paracoccus denitrificans]MCU7427596.1 sigma-54 dependent transcriptional regulator [Paracoccus denitrificans]QAR29687.1 sigma-54-dependent Fis family transcriptional regulator [Paracoccus denitrificans]UPV98539.1 sigma-54 d
MPEVMLVEDDADLRQATAETLELAGFRVHAFDAAAPALDVLRPDFPGVILSDLRMPGLSGLDFLDRARGVAPDVPFVLITAHGDVPAAIRAMRGGAHDFLEKPCAPELMLDVLKRAQAMRDLHLENARLRQIRIEDRLIGRSAAMQDLRQRLRALAGLQLDLLIAGETGTGKELVARILHDLSPRGEGPFVAINCGALSEPEVDRELFGTSDAPGLIARAEGGTLYLDELESMPDGLQVRLLRVVESREITPLGAAPRPVDLRILGSVKRPPDVLTAEGRLRADLFHRFNATLPLPSLREREDDAALLVTHFAAEAAARHDLPKPHIDSVLRRRIAYHDWPGNVREARNLAERLVIGLDTDFPTPGPGGETAGMGYDAAMEGFEARLLRSALIQTGGRKAEAAALLGIPRKRLYLRLRHLDML